MHSGRLLVADLTDPRGSARTNPEWLPCCLLSEALALLSLPEDLQFSLEQFADLCQALAPELRQLLPTMDWRRRGHVRPGGLRFMLASEG